MKRLSYFRAGAVAYILLGIMHLLSQMSKNRLDENVLKVLAQMKETSFDFMGQHNLMQFYTGFSVVMGIMLFAFGLQAIVVEQPSRLHIFINIAISFTTTILAMEYFHPLAYSFLLFATLSFGIAYFINKN